MNYVPAMPRQYPGKAGVRGTAPEPEWGSSGKKRARLNVGSERNFGEQLAIICRGFLFFFRLWAPKPALEPSPGLPRLRDTSRHSGAGPETLCIIIWSCNRSLVMLFLKSKPGVVWELRNFLRPINASMKEATAKRHLLKDFNGK